MSSTPFFDLIARFVVSTVDEEAAKGVLNHLREDLPELSFSPLREEPSLNNALDCMATAVVDMTQKDLILSKWNNDWDHEEERNGTEAYWAYGFNTKMFDPLLYYAELEFRPRR